MWTAIGVAFLFLGLCVVIAGLVGGGINYAINGGFWPLATVFGICGGLVQGYRMFYG